MTHFIIIVPYRCKPPHETRKIQLRDMIENFSNVFHDYHARDEYTIIVVEQDDDKLFNRGWLMNVGFQESTTLLGESIVKNNNTVFLHTHVDFRIPIDRPLPSEFSGDFEGFLDIYGYPDEKCIGGFCLFRYSTYLKCNGYPNNIWGWGGDDWALYKRTILAKVPRTRPSHIYRSYVHEIPNHDISDTFKNDQNMRIASSVTTDTLFQEGLNTTKYSVSHQSYDPKNHVHHICVQWAK